MIHFNELPTEIPGGEQKEVPEGSYIGVIQKAEMRTSKTSGSEYLSITWECYDKMTNELVGRVFENISESTNTYVMAKLRRFIEALHINLGNQFELKDLSKVVPNKKCIINIGKGKDGKLGVDLFKNYEPLETTTPIDINVPVTDKEEIPFPMPEPETTSDENY